MRIALISGTKESGTVYMTYETSPARYRKMQEQLEDPSMFYVECGVYDVQRKDIYKNGTFYRASDPESAVGNVLPTVSERVDKNSSDIVSLQSTIVNLMHTMVNMQNK